MCNNMAQSWSILWTTKQDYYQLDANTHRVFYSLPPALLAEKSIIGSGGSK